MLLSRKNYEGYTFGIGKIEQLVVILRNYH